MAEKKALSAEEVAARRKQRQRTYDEMDVNVPYPVEQAVVVDASQRMSKWQRMRSAMLAACGMTMDDIEPTVVNQEAVYIIAKAMHPFDGDCTVCLVEKSRGRGCVLIPESALRPIHSRAIISVTGQQYSKWATMEEKMDVKVTPEFQAKSGQVGLVVAKEVHPKDPETQVLAVQIPDGGIVLVKSKAVKVLPVDVVEVVDPRARYTAWPKMAQELGVVEPKEPKETSDVQPGEVGIAKVCGAAGLGGG